MAANQTRSVDLPFEPARVISGLQNVVQAESGAITGPNTYNVKIANFWYTLFMKVQMDGTYSVVATPTGSRLTLTLTCNMNALTPVLITNIVCFLIIPPFILGVLVDILTWNYFSNQAPGQILGRLVDRLNAGVAQAQGQPQPQPQPQPQYQPQPAAAPVTPPQPQPAATEAASPQPAPEAASDPYEQLKKLAMLRDAGAITPEEFDAKKAELLARI